MIRHTAALILLALLLTGCAPPPVMDAPEAAMAPAIAPQCQPGDDGIGGTGCHAE